ncbi:MAG: phosphatidate cytidylyltransferase [Kineosporiaceae bacterium]
MPVPARRARVRGAQNPPTSTIPVLRPGLPVDPVTGSSPLPPVLASVPPTPPTGVGPVPASPPVDPTPVEAVPSGTPAGGLPSLTRRQVRTGRTGELPVVADAAPSAAPARTGRAGRNLPLATAVGVVLGGAVAASLFARKEAFVGVAALAVVLGMWELGQALKAKSLQIPVVPLAVGSVGMLVSAFVAGPQGLLVAFALTAFGVLLWRLLDGLQGAARDVAAGIFAAAYLPLLAGFAALMLAADDGPLRVVTFIAVTIASDIGGYVAGVLFGKHPMAPTVSPKKSWEGFAGSAIACVGVGTAAVTLLLSGPWWAGAAIGACAVLTATLGDLSESLLKRDLGIKDMSSILPGHGGIMDRLDSLLPTAPVVYLLLSWWVSG